MQIFLESRRLRRRGVGTVVHYADSVPEVTSRYSHLQRELVL